MIVIDVFLQFPSERPRGGVQLRDWGSSLAAFCGVFPLLHSPLASFSLCLLLFSLTDFAFTFDLAFVFLAFVLISPVDCIGLGCEWILFGLKEVLWCGECERGKCGGGPWGGLWQRKRNQMLSSLPA